MIEHVIEIEIEYSIWSQHADRILEQPDPLCDQAPLYFVHVYAQEHTTIGL